LVDCVPDTRSLKGNSHGLDEKALSRRDEM
jgi:hypothetical protein